MDSKQTDINIDMQKRLKLLETAVEQSANTVVITNVEGIIEYVNKKFTQLTGYTYQEALGQNSRILKTEVQSPDYYKNMWNTISKGESWTGEFCNKKKNGEYYWESATIAPIKNDKNEIVNYIAIKEDITARRKVEMALKDSEARWNFALEGSGDGVWDWNMITDEVFFSKQWKAMLGYEEHEIVNKLTEWEKRVHPDDIQKCYKDIKEHVQEKKAVYVNEHRMMHKNGEYIWILDRGKIIERTPGGEPARMIGTHTDITIRKKNEEDLCELNATKDKLFSIIAHDLINPFGNIINLSEIILSTYDKCSPEKIKQGIEMINSSGQKAYDLLSNLLEWARIQRSKVNVSPEKFNLCELTNEVMHLLEGNAKTKQIQLVNNVPADFYVTADMHMISTVIRNLVSNAIKFTPRQGSVKINAKKTGREKLLEVADTGVGIDKSKIETLFTIDKSKSTRGTDGEAGTGLGLILCKEFVEKNKGRIEIESSPGEGTVFKVFLPATP
jgi:PAS domain S-box-containing protein